MVIQLFQLLLQSMIGFRNNNYLVNIRRKLARITTEISILSWNSNLRYSPLFNHKWIFRDFMEL